MSISPTESETEPIIRSDAIPHSYGVTTSDPMRSTISEEVKEFYRIKIPSLEIEIYTDPNTTSPIIELPKTGDIYHLSLKSDAPVLPPRLQGEIPNADEHGLLGEHKALQSLIQYRKQRVQSFLKVFL
jgi:hypothetical protein